MATIWVIAFLVLGSALIKVGEPVLTCLNGNDLPLPRDCHHVKRCGAHEYCSLEQYITPNGFIQHKASCKDKALCGGTTVSSTYMVVCSECCDTDLCSASGCHQTGYNTNRGQICYHCDYPVDNPLQCDKIKPCSVDEVCGMHRTPYGQYKMGCESKLACATAQNLGICSTCCSSDLCNTNCTVKSGITLTTPPTSTCMDHKDCRILSSTLSSVGQDICQNLSLKHYCNYTCGLCPGQTTRATTVTPNTALSTTTASSTVTVSTAPHPCSPDPCQHGACVPSGTVFVCVCSPGYMGPTCASVDPCHPNPCVHGTCGVISNAYHCTCQASFTGRLCDTAIDPCLPNPCIHGTCSPAGSSYSCACYAGYTGSTCATVHNPCLPNPCVHGSCTQIGVSFMCNCNAGYTGQKCDTVLNTCLPNPCIHGSCTQIGVSFVCNCYTGYTGQTCDTVTDPCLPNPCVHGACSIAGSSFTCRCNAGYIGNTCANRDPCSVAPCIHGNCTTHSSGGYRCSCQPGYTGMACDTDIDECQSSPCVHGTCRDNVNGYTCSCFPGYTDKQCSTDINDCAPVNPCRHGVCHDQLNGFRCVCANGYNGTLCDKLVKWRDCKDIQMSGKSHGSALYRLDLSSPNTLVRCEMTTDGGGWTILLNRNSDSVDFQNKDSTDYAVGFGDKNHDFWQGLEDMHALTSDGRRYQLRVDMIAANGTYYYEVYDDFHVGPARDFPLHIGKFSGTAGDSLSGHNGFGFTTHDHDVDTNKIDCADYLGGGWWFHDCYDSCLTCPYISGATPGTQECSSMSWNSVRYCEPLSLARMMVRPM